MRTSYVRTCRLLLQSPKHTRVLGRASLLPSRPLRWSSNSAREWSTPLAQQLAEAIETRGPIPIADYMRQCLTNPDAGYYSSRTAEGGDPFGKKGDFVTSPEISQIFGELIGVWFVAAWMAQGQKTSGVELIELGPGRGTLMDDALRTISNFKSMSTAIDKIYLVESSKALRDQQKKLLCGDAEMVEDTEGFRSRSKHLPNTEVIWIEDLSFKVKDMTKHPFIMAHEFFDALPIHTFQSTPKPRDSASGTSSKNITTSVTPEIRPPSYGENEWRELLVSNTAPPSTLNPPTKPGPEFELALSATTTRYSRLLPNISPRYKSLLSTSGSTIEISSEARTTTSLLAQLIGGASTGDKRTAGPEKSEPSGAALIIDYGPSETIPVNSLRGIRNHQRCSPFDQPGRVDLSVDVDFGALVESALEGSENVEVHGPVEQADWLRAMGGTERSKALIRNAKKKEGGDEIADRISTGWTRLVDRGPNGMGKLYKAMAILPVTNLGQPPVGFGGDVAI